MVTLVVFSSFLLPLLLSVLPHLSLVLEYFPVLDISFHVDKEEDYSSYTSRAVEATLRYILDSVLERFVPLPVAVGSFEDNSSPHHTTLCGR